MDRLRRKRPSLPGQGQAQSGASLPKLDTEVSSSPAESSPASSVNESKSDFFQSMVPKAIRSLSRASTPRSPNPESPNSPLPPRKVLQKTHSRRASGYDFIGRRGSTSSEGYSRISRASTTISGSSANSIDWRSQSVETHAALESDPQSLRSKAGYLVMTTDYVVIFKNKADAFAAFPQMTSGGTTRGGAALLAPEPLYVIPFNLIVAVFRAESSRPSFGVEVWWRAPYPAISFSSAQFFFNMPGERELHMRNIREMIRGKTKELPDVSRVAFEVEDCIGRLVNAEEPAYAASRPEVFPVAYRSGSSRKGQQDGASFYLVVGINLCLFVEIAKASAVQEAPLQVHHQSFGLVTLESLRGDWSPHEERFVLRFRDPFKHPVTLELASRYYKQIILTLMKADKQLKPAWPTVWQTEEIFHVTELPEPQQIVAGEDFGAFHRTLTAYCAAYRCEPVEWEINWKTVLAPEFCVLPPKNGGDYSDLQLLAVLRALRYNDYFMSCSFRDVNLAELWEKYDSNRKGSVAYMSRSGICLDEHECSVVQKASVLHQEFHALAFTSETVRQIDFTNSLRGHQIYQGDPDRSTAQFMAPILNLLRAGLTRCSRLVLRNCPLGAADVDELLVALASNPPINLEVLDVANCGLPDVSLQALFRFMHNTGRSLQVLNVSGNLGRVPAPLVSSVMESFANLTSLNLSGVLMGTVDGELLPFSALTRLSQLEELNVSNFKLNDASQRSLDKYLLQLSSIQAYEGGTSQACAFRSLVMNNCGITGYGAGRIFNAMTGLDRVHLHLNGNPLEAGIDHLARSIGLCWKGRFGLHMDMIEFREEANYIRLVKALAANRHIYFLSLAGTAPTPTADATCSAQTCEALEQFLACNETVEFLDLSGYSGKLDEGQLGRGFGRALRGLAANRTITHLRLRNQNLHDDIGDLGSAIKANSSLRYLDCEDNNFNLTSLRFIASNLQQNGSILEFPFTQDEQARILDRCRKGMPAAQPAQPPARKKATSAAGLAAAEAQVSMFRSEIRASAAAILASTGRNRAALERETGHLLVLDDDVSAADTGGGAGWPNIRLKAAPYSNQNNNSSSSSSSTPTDTAQAAQQQVAAAVEQRRLQRHRSTVRSSSVAPPDAAALQTPYHVQQDDDALNSPTEVGSPLSDLPTTPELEELAEITGPKEHEGGGGGGGIMMDDHHGVARGAAVDLGPDLAKMWVHFKLTSSAEADP